MQTRKAPFRTFKDAPAAEDLVAWLRLQDIDAELSNTSAYFDPSFAHSILSREWTVLIPAKDFTEATAALQHYYEQRLNAVPCDYYLYSFSNDELEAILARPDEWGDLDYALAREILDSRGLRYSDEQLASLRTARYEELSRPETERSGIVVLWGYVLSAIAGLIGSLVGWYLMHGRKTLPDGKTVPRYAAAATTHGRRIFWLGILVTLIYTALRMYYTYTHGVGRLFP